MNPWRYCAWRLTKTLLVIGNKFTNIGLKLDIRLRKHPWYTQKIQREWDKVGGRLVIPLGKERNK